MPRYLGSRATYVRGAQGGLKGRALRSGDRLQTRPDARRGRSSSPAADHAGAAPQARSRPGRSGSFPARRTHLFSDEGVETFFSDEWKLSPTSDRMGFRFIGPKLEMKPRPDYLERDAGSGPADIVDDIIPVGGIQVPGGIEPIAMGVENPTAGGYAKIGTVISADLGVLGQIRPLEQVFFQSVSVEEALDIARAEADATSGPALGQSRMRPRSTSTATAARASASGSSAPTTSSCR